MEAVSNDAVLVVGLVAVMLAAAALAVALWALRVAEGTKRRQPEPVRPPPPSAVPDEWLVRQVQRLRQDVTELAEAHAAWTAKIEAEVPETSAVLPAETPVQEAPSASLWRDGEPVELDGDQLRRSQSISALGSLVLDSDAARLYLNDTVELDHVRYREWSRFYDFQEGGPYMRYRTVEPSVVAWDEIAGRGRVIHRGVAKVVR